MLPAHENPDDLSPEQEELLDGWLVKFEQGWDEGALARLVADLPAEGALRRAALAELVEIDLLRSWQHGHKKHLETYLLAYPELGSSETVSLGLIQAEILARRESGEPLSLDELGRRFPRQ